METSDTAGYGTSDHGSSAGRDHAGYASRQSTDVEAPRSQLKTATSTCMTSPGRPQRNRATRSFRQLRRFHHVNSDRVFGTHKQRKPALCQPTRVAGRENRENRQDAIQLDEEPTIVFCEPDAATQVAPQDNQLVSE